MQCSHPVFASFIRCICHHTCHFNILYLDLLTTLRQIPVSIYLLMSCMLFISLNWLDIFDPRTVVYMWVPQPKLWLRIPLKLHNLVTWWVTSSLYLYYWFLVGSLPVVWNVLFWLDEVACISICCLATPSILVEYVPIPGSWHSIYWWVLDCVSHRWWVLMTAQLWLCRSLLQWIQDDSSNVNRGLIKH